MIIERNLAKYVVFTDDSLSHALQKISDNKSGLVFVLAQNGVLEGVLTDGDFRRWLLQTKKMDLSLPAELALNKEFVFSFEDAAPELIEKQFSDRIECVPLVDRQSRLVGIATCKQQGVQIGQFNISQEAPSFLIAEIGNNHNGSFDLAMRLVDEIVISGADCAKFQMRDMSTMYQKDASGNDASEDLGAQYTLDLLSKFQLSNEELFKIFDYCKHRGILPLCTPWDMASLKALETYGMAAYKLASADLTNPELLEALCKTRKPLICSTGMSSESEISEAINLLKRQGAQYILLHCNSTYPAPFKDINLNYLDRLKQLGEGCVVGYSGHERGYSIALAAVARGARVIEKHFTLDRNMEGNDHRVSLLPNEFSEMVRGIREIELALGSSGIRKITQGEMMNREILGKSLLASMTIKKDEIITATHLMIRSPGKGLAPYRKHDLIGRPSKRDMKEGDFFFLSDVDDSSMSARNYKFDRPFGIPVRYHDVAAMLNKSNFDLLEFHLSYKDLEIDPSDYLDPLGYDLNFVVHSPELFIGDHIMDLCSDDLVYRSASMKELQRVIDITRSLKKFFPKTTRPCIVINAGGFTLDEFMPKENRVSKYKLIAEALQSLDTDGVEIIPQTMPPFPWHFGGQRYHNIFMEAQDIVDFCIQQKMRVCLDISHSKLACTHLRTSFSAFLDAVAPFAAHIHIVDAEGVDGEGLQIGDGEIDFIDLGKKLHELCPKASFIPEIWQGHKNQGEGFWIALERLESAFN
jgi:sialic acid synthase SpsE/sugar phosphate isomerase/epimerase